MHRHDDRLAPRVRRTAGEHQAALLSNVSPLAAQWLPLLRARGRALAQDVASRLDLPPWDNSSMDGYAVRSDEVGPGAVLPVVDVVAAGDGRDLTLARGTAVRIMTGAPMPAGADAVVPVEETDAGTTQVTFDGRATPRAFVRGRAEDVRAGDLVLHSGEILTPARLALLAGTGHHEVLVHRAPRVLVLSTGSELVAPGAPLNPGAIYDSNAVQLAALLEGLGAEVETRAVPDDVEQLAAVLAEVSGAADLVVTTGGVSVGEFDVVRDAVPGLELASVSMQPGKPQGSARLAGGTLLIALPGNPVSSFVSFEMFVRPVVLRLAGAAQIHRRRLQARVGETFVSRDGREQYARVRLDWDGSVPTAHPVGGWGSHLMGALSAADGLAVVPAGVSRVTAGEELAVIDLREEPQ